MSNKKIIYTVITNGYDKLKEPLQVTPNWEYIAYVDDKTKYKSKVWDIREFRQLKSLTPSLNNRKQKINIPFRSDCTSIYIDGSIEIKKDLDSFLRKVGHKQISALGHHARGCIYDEAQQVKKLKKASDETVDNWINKIYREGYPKNNGLNQCGVLIRENNERVRELMSEWWEIILNDVSRDQLAFNYLMWKHNERVNTINLRLFNLYFKIHNHK